MGRMTPYEQARREGIRAAQREHLRLGTELHRRVDVFDIIEEARVWLFFKPLRNLYGLYHRADEAAGIIINANHPLTMQRFTAAHEYGHHVLGHEASADDENRILRVRMQDLQEVAAQAFAGEFIMPLQLVNYTLRTMGLGINPPPLDARQVYQLALELGVSYSAAVTQLVGQRKLTPHGGRELRGRRPLAVKTDLVGARPEDSWADVWLLDETQEGRELTPRVRDEIHVVLPETPSSGYVWNLVDPVGDSVALVDDGFDPASDAVGASGRRHLRFRVLRPGEHRLRLAKQRPWEHSAQPAATFEAVVRASPTPTGDSAEGLAVEQKTALLEDAHAA